ncbi:flavin monoamine oxidase family protein [Yinghuangia seranimata]|uniref:flavin monoamine oxidase family protein n=1 Tax=Yinghuangia seranimata TaxID=408067 RepID=UPI00248D0C7C|nr:NAD(P)/FAD-dependent oxidoreductase [Yinghuangia seranimata]MDI2128560.1 NAD(P)/FAD-dependent oxidoreductase [Yinghuangia seranimata]
MEPAAPSSPRPSAARLRVANRAGIPDPLRAAMSVHAEARRLGMPTADVAGAVAENTERRRARAAEREAGRATVSRRQVLGAAGALAAVSALPGGLLSPSAANAATAPRVVVVGAGLAGLRCAHKLWTSPRRIAATVYEADTTHIGGRCWSLRDFFANGQVSEHGGSFISTGDKEMLALAKRFGIATEVHNGGGLTSGDYLAWINHTRYSGFDEELEAFIPAINASYEAMGWPRYNDYTPEALRLDRMSAIDYMTEIGLDPRSRLGQFVQSRILQNGGEPSDVSAIDFVGFFAAPPAPGNSGGNGPDAGYFDEMFHLKGGNDQVVSGMLRELPAGTVKQGHELVAVRLNGNGSYTCTFDRCGTIVEVTADHVVLALPFRTLRNVDLNGAGLSSLKRRAIAQQGMGQNAKLVLQLDRKTWPAAGSNGITLTGPDGYQTAWDGSVELGENGGPALLVNFPGGNTARYRYTGAAHGPAPSADVAFFLDQIENLLPGTRAAFNGRAYEDHWSVDPWHFGAYHYYRVGQITAFGGYEQVQEGRVHFAGEHTSDGDATLNAAVKTGERAAGEILAQV